MHLKSCILLLFLIVFQLTKAQERKFNFGVGLFPNLSFGIITNNGNTPGYVENAFKSIEVSQIAYSINGFAEYNLSKRTRLGIGLGLQKNGEQTGKMELIFQVNPITGQPIVNPSDPTHAKSVYNHYNVEVPLYFKLNFGKKSYFLIGGSALLNFSNTNTQVLYYSNRKKERNTVQDNSTDFRTFNVMGNIGYGIDYLKREKITLFFQPYVQYGILGISKTANLNRNILSIGFVTGIRL